MYKIEDCSEHGIMELWDGEWGEKRAADFYLERAANCRRLLHDLRGFLSFLFAWMLVAFGLSCVSVRAL